MKHLFTETSACLRMVHCPTCRDKDKGSAWRDSLRNAYRLPNDDTNFVCPHGAEWSKPLSRGFGDTLEKLFKLLGLGHGRCGGCHKRRDKLNKMFPYKRKEIA